MCLHQTLERIKIIFVSLFQFLSQQHDLSFDMTGSLTSTPTHNSHHSHHHFHHQQQQLTNNTAALITATATAVPPSAQSTPISLSSNDLQQQHQQLHHHSSLLTTPTLSSSNTTAVTAADISAHSTPKLAKFSPERSHHHHGRGSGEAPRTPTPFKRALAEVYRGREPLSNTPQTPTKRVEDITEIIKKDLEDLTDLSFNRSMEHQVPAPCRMET